MEGCHTLSAHSPGLHGGKPYTVGTLTITQWRGCHTLSAYSAGLRGGDAAHCEHTHQDQMERMPHTVTHCRHTLDDFVVEMPHTVGTLTRTQWRGCHTLSAHSPGPNGGDATLCRHTPGLRGGDATNCRHTHQDPMERMPHTVGTLTTAQWRDYCGIRHMAYPLFPYIFLLHQ